MIDKYFVTYACSNCLILVWDISITKISKSIFAAAVPLSLWYEASCTNASIYFNAKSGVDLQELTSFFSHTYL